MQLLTTNRFLPLRGLTLAALLACAATAHAVDAIPLIQGGKFAITSADLEADALMRMPPEMRPKVLSNKQSVGQVAINMYVRRALGQQAVQQGLDKDPQVAAMLQLARDKVLSDVMLERIDRQNAPSDAAALQQARAIYTAKPERFKAGEQVHVRHILIAGNTPESRARAEKLLEELKAGADFATLAKENSADKGSADNGGDLGLFGRNRMVPPFEEAAFELKNKGDLSGVVESQFGYHIIQLEGRKPAYQRPFDEVKDELVREVRASVTQEARVAAAQKLQQGVDPDTKGIDAFTARYAKELPAAKP
ncbi:MAG: peptidylprolyl isomerase [Alicycliphilus denitrificans]|nr:peptidylprolyl isomerase [Alicycliphilus denitrificans]